MGGPSRSARRRGSGPARRGQAMVEFSLVIGLFLLCLLGAMSASIYAVQRSAAVTAVAAGARVAAGGTSAAGGSSIANLSGAAPSAAHVVAPVLIGTSIRELPPAESCPAIRTIPPGEVDICTTLNGGTVSVRLRGRPASAL